MLVLGDVGWGDADRDEKTIFGCWDDPLRVDMILKGRSFHE